MQDRKIKQQFILFVVTFLVSLIVITYFIKSFSPNVDVEIGGEEEQIENQQDSDSDVKNAIDDRLRWIQLEDNMPGASKREDLEDNDENTTDEKVRTNKQPSEKTSKLKELDPIDFVAPNSNSSKEPPIPNTEKQIKIEPPKMSKVYVGPYATIEQAINAQSKIMEANSAISPFVKEVNGKYVLQAGSYANANKAEAIAKDINTIGLNAKVVKE
jgi:cell division protein FtsN